jgi:trehalose 6-phosphate synthase
VTYLQITPRSRSKIREYIEMERRVSSAAGHINGMHGDAAWTPIRYINQSYGRNVLAGLYRSARVGLVTPLRDGMNLVAKEYLASQNVDDPGVLVLSRFAGAARECEAALLVNPYDADAIARALSMPIEERRERHKTIMRVLTQNDSKFWGEKFLTALELTYDEMTMFADMTAPPHPRAERVRQKSA